MASSVGPKLASGVERLAGPKVVNLLGHLPGSLVDRRHAPAIADAREDEIATLTVKVERHRKPPNRRLPYKVIVSDASGRLNLLMARQGHMLETVAIDELVARRKVLETYQNQARYAFADSFDRAAKQQAPAALQASEEQE